MNYHHRGCNNLTGNFTVNQLSFKAAALDTFGVSFNQSCDGGALMSGTFYYNAPGNRRACVARAGKGWLSDR